MKNSVTIISANGDLRKDSKSISVDEVSEKELLLIIASKLYSIHKIAVIFSILMLLSMLGLLISGTRSY